MKTTRYLRMLPTERDAMDWMRMVNQSYLAAGNRRDKVVVTDGPSNNFAVMDLRSAIEKGGGYKWES